MQVTCPNCGKPVPADNINIQQMAAVCPACNAVFQFDLADTKHKRRKVKQPQQLILNETDSDLSMGFRTNFHLDRNADFLLGGIISVVFTFVTLALVGESEWFIALAFGLATLLLYYRLALLVFNKTHIDIDDERIMVSRQPLPNFLSQPNTITLSGVETIRYEETPISKSENYDMPRYNVWAQMVDGTRKVIVSDVIDDYAIFISQRLNERLDLDSAPDVARLTDAERDIAAEQLADEFSSQSQLDNQK